jgi:hypothetical protein
MPRTYAVLSEWGNVPISTLCHRKHGRRSKEALAQSRQYLIPEEEKALVKFVLLMSSLGHPVRIKFMRSLAYRIALRRSTNRPLKPPGPNWPRAFEKRHAELRARRVKAIDWKRHDNHIRLHEKSLLVPLRVGCHSKPATATVPNATLQNTTLLRLS